MATNLISNTNFEFVISKLYTTLVTIVSFDSRPRKYVDP